MLTYVGLSFGVTRWVGRGIYIEVLFQEEILSIKFFNLLR